MNSKADLNVQIQSLALGIENFGYSKINIGQAGEKTSLSITTKVY